MNVTTGRYYCDEVSPLRPLHAFLSLFVDSLDRWQRDPVGGGREEGYTC